MNRLHWAGFLIASLFGCGAPQQYDVDGVGTSSAAIVGGQLDNGAHPNVGTIVLGSPLRSQCSGTLIAPDVFLTVAHCALRTVGLEHGSWGVSFDETWTPASTLHYGYGFSHPMFDFNTGYHDVGIVVLDEPVEGIEPALVAPNRYLEKQDLEGETFVTVGYGTTDPDPDHRWVERGTRRVGGEGYLGLTAQNLVLDKSLSHGFSGVCFGDSGGPIFFDGLLVAVTSHGNGRCGTGDADVDYAQRVDAWSARSYINSFLYGDSSLNREDFDAHGTDVSGR